MSDVFLISELTLDKDPCNQSVLSCDINIDVPPIPKGYWAIEENFHVPVYVVPSAWRRWWTRRLLGWKWVVEVNSSVR